MQHATLDGRANSDGLVRVDVLARFLAEEFLDQFLYFGHPGHAADQDHVADVGNLHAGILDGGLARPKGALDQFLDQRLELGPGDFHDQVLRPAGIGGDIGQVDLGLGGRAELDLGLLGGLFQALQSQHVVLQIDALLFLELVDDVVDQALVEVLTTQEGIAIGGQHLELMLALDLGDLDDRDVEGAATQVEHRDLAVAFLLIHAEGERGGGRLVDDALHVQAGDTAGVLGGLTLAVVEVGRHGDDGLGDLFAQIVLGGLLHLLQHLGGDLRRGLLVAAHLHPGITVVGLENLVGHQADVLLDLFFLKPAADQTLDGVQGVLGVGHRLPLGWRAAEDFAVFRVGDDGRRGARTFRVFDDFWFAAFHDGDARVGGAQVDADDLGHDVISSRNY